VLEQGTSMMTFERLVKQFY